MIKSISLALYRLNQQKPARMAMYGLTAVIGLQLMNILLLQLLGLNNTALPWSFMSVLKFGFVMPTFVATIIVVTPIAALYLWVKGGVERAVAQNVALYWIGFVSLSSLGLYVFSVWEGINIQPYPWLIYSLLERLPQGSDSLSHLVISLFGCYSLLFVSLVYKCFSSKTKAEKVFGSAHFSNAFEIQKSDLFLDKGIIIGKAFGKVLRLPGYESVLVVAPTGSGKTTAIAVPNLLEWQGSGVFNDLKGELYRLTANHRRTVLKNECYKWAPANPEKQTQRYNPFFYVSKNPDLMIRDLQLIAETLIPATRMGVGFWYQSSREIFLTLSLYLFETKHMATLSEIHDLSKQKNFFVWLITELKGNESKFSSHFIQNSYSILNCDEKTKQNILKDFHSRMSLFNDPLVGYATSGNDFDFRELRRNRISIYINIPDSDKERLSPILTLFWSQLINVMSSNEPAADERYGVLALMDEFGNMARINKLKDGMSFLRSYHVRCVVIVQYLSQITSVYGRDDSKGFLNSKVKIAFALNDIDDANFFSKSLGNKTVKVASSSVSTGHGDRGGSRSENINYRARALMSPDGLMQLSNEKSIILIESKSPIFAGKYYWFKQPRYGGLGL